MIAAGTKEIITDYLILRRFKLSDAESACRNWAGDKEVQDMYGEPVYPTVEQTKKLLGKYIYSYRKNSYRWAVIEKESGECIGQIAFFLVNENNNFAEIEYCIGSAFQCRGYATEATRALLKYGFDEMNLHKIQISHRPSNTASQKVIQKCGFTYEGSLRDYFLRGGEYEDRMYYSILEREYSLYYRQ